MKKAIFLLILSAVLITGGITAVIAGSSDETAMHPEEEIIDVASINWSQIDNIEAYAEEHGLTLGVDYGDEVVDYNETIAVAFNSEEAERERAEIEALLEELETGEVITYYPETDKMVIE